MGFNRQQWQEFGYTMPVSGAQTPALVAGETYTKKQPIRPASIESDVVTPFWQSVITAIGLAITILFAVLLGLSIRDKWLLQIQLVLGFFVLLALAFLIMWGILLGAHRSLLWLVETITGKDLDDNSSIGKPKEEEWVRSEILDKDKNQMQRVEFKFSPDALSKVAVAVLHDGKNFSRRALSNEVTETQFRTLQQQMLKRGLCHWKDAEHENLGVELSGGGRAFLRGYLPK